MRNQSAERCESCGAVLPVDGASDDFSPQQRRIYHALLSAGTAGLSLQELTAKTWGHRSDGGPLNTALTISITTRKMRVKLAKHGMTIVARPRSGPHARRYLERL